MATSSLYGSVSESTGLYGIGAASGGTYFEWFIFYDSATAPATPTGGSWDFNANTGTTPTGWLLAPPAAPTNQVWVSIAIVDSRSTASLVWSTPGLMTGSGLPILTASGVPSSGTGLNGQLYVNTATTPQSMYLKESGAWTQITGATLYATAGANTNITSLTGITGGISSATYLQLNTAGDGATAAGKMQWDTTWNGPQIGMGGGNVNLQVGQETLIYVYNNTGSTLTDGQVVYCTGSQGQRLTVGLALANADATSATILGVVTETIANNSSGFVTTQGMVNGLNTSGFADGAVIYLSPTTAGAWTTTKPQAPQHLVQVGYVVKGGSGGAGSIYVNTQNGYELDELHDVRITSIANKNLLQYDMSVPAWVNIAGPNGAIVGTTDTQTLTNKSISGSSNTLTNIPNSALVNDHVTVNGVALTLGAVQTVGASWILPSYTGNAGKVLAVNPSASDVQWITAGGVGTVTSIDVSGGTTGLTTFGGPITAAGTITLGGTLNVANGGTGVTTSTGTGSVVLSTSPTLVTPNLGTPTAGNFSTGTFTWPTFNQDTTGNAATATTATNVSGGTASVTTLTTSSTVTINGGTANGVAYLNGSKVLTTGSALTFDGTNLGLGVTPSAWGGGNKAMEQIGGSLFSGAIGNIYLGNNTYYNGTNWVYKNTAAASYYAQGAAAHTWYQAASGTAGATVSWTQAMTLNASGNLGIGTSSPAAKLDVATTTGFTFGTTSTAGVNVGTQGTVGGSFMVNTASLGPTYGSGFAVDGTYSGGKSTINLKAFGVYSGGPYGSDLAFFTSSATTLSEKMRLDTSGNLGLGVTPSAWSQGRAIEVFGVGNALWSAAGVGDIRLLSNTYFNGGFKYAGSGTAAALEVSSGSFKFFNTSTSGTAGAAITFTQAMTLDASGNLGIGITSPTAALHIYKATPKMYVQDSVGGAAIGLEAGASYAGVTALNTYNNYPIVFGVNNSEKMRLDTSGNLGLGVTPSGSWGSPALMLGKPGAGNPTYPFITSTNTQQIVIGSNSYWDGTNWKAAFAGTAVTAAQQRINYNEISWHVAGAVTQGVTQSFTQAMTLDQSGNLLVGKTSTGIGTAGNELGVSGYGMFTRSGDVSLFLNRLASDGNTAQFYRSGTQVGSISVTTTATAYNTSSDYRLKNITGPITSSGVYIDSLNPVEGTWKADGSTFVGLIAHEVQEASRTQVATGVKDGEQMQAMDYSNSELIANMIAELQSVRKRLAQLESK